MKAILNNQFVRFVVSALLSVAAGVLAVNAVALQHNWGFEFVRAIMGQAEHSGQWLGALLIQNALVSPIAAGLVFGYLRGFYRGSFWWNFFAFVVPVWYYISLLVFAAAPGYSNSSLLDARLADIPLEAVLPMLVSMILFYLSNATGGWIYSQLCRRTRLLRIIVPGLLAMLFISVFEMSTAELGRVHRLWLVQELVDAIALMTASAFAVGHCGKHSKVAAVLCAVFCAMPFYLFDLSNMLFVGSELGEIADTVGGILFNDTASLPDIDRDTLRARASSIIIFSTHILASALGAYIGFGKGKR